MFSAVSEDFINALSSLADADDFGEFKFRFVKMKGALTDRFTGGEKCAFHCSSNKVSFQTDFANPA